jgi:hypothetical protein
MAKAVPTQSSTALTATLSCSLPDKIHSHVSTLTTLVCSLASAPTRSWRVDAPRFEPLLNGGIIADLPTISLARASADFGFILYLPKLATHLSEYTVLFLFHGSLGLVQESVPNEVLSSNFAELPCSNHMSQTDQPLPFAP